MPHGRRTRVVCDAGQSSQQQYWERAARVDILMYLMLGLEEAAHIITLHFRRRYVRTCSALAIAHGTMRYAHPDMSVYYDLYV